MKKILLLVLFFSFFSLSGFAITTEQQLFEQKYQLEQQKEQIKELKSELKKVTDDLENEDKSTKDKLTEYVKTLEGADKRITDTSIWLSVYGVLITILLLIVAWSSRNTAIATAKEESQATAKTESQKLLDEWINNKADNDFKELAEEKLNAKLIEFKREADNKLDNNLKDFETKANSQLKEFETKYEAELNVIKQQVKITDEKQDVERLFNKAYRLGQEDKTIEEIKVYDELITKYKNSKLDDVQEYIALSMRNKGISLDGLNQNEEAIKVFDALITQFKDSKHKGIQEEVVKAMLNKGFSLGHHGRGEEAIKVFDAVITQFKDSKHKGIQQQVIKAMINKYEWMIFKNNTLSKEENEWLESINIKLEDKASFGLLSIIDKAKESIQDDEITRWQEEYKEIKTKFWSFEELKAWIVDSSYNEEVKNRINGYIDIFEKHLHRD